MPIEIGKVVEGKVSSITNFGAFIKLPDGKTGLVHISEIADEFVKDIKAHLKENQPVKVKIISIDSNGRINLSIKKAADSKPRTRSIKPAELDWERNNNDNLSFEERLAKFLKDSEERMLDLKRNFESKRGSGGYRKSVYF